MAIILDNGVTLPDIPEGVLEKYPFAFIIFYQIDGHAGSYTLTCTPTEVYYDNTANLLCTPSTGYYSAGMLADNTEEWLGTSEYTDLFEGELSGKEKIVWANYDIMVAVDVDDSGNVTTDGIYFPSSEAGEVIEYIATSTDLKAVADAIRSKGGTTGKLVFPNGFTAAIEAISGGAGGSVQRADGACAFSNGFAEAECGFKPDFVFLEIGGEYTTTAGKKYVISAAVAFAEESRLSDDTKMNLAMLTVNDGTVGYYEIYPEQTDTGFVVMMVTTDGTPYTGPCNYVAVNYSQLNSGGTGVGDIPTTEGVLF